jgi:hypothetical protein
MSAIAPAGKVNSVAGSAETVAAVLWAPMQLSGDYIASQSFRKAGFLNASQVEVFLDVSSMGG